MSNEARTVILRWFDEVWNQGREETIDELMAPDGIGHGLGASDADLLGPAGFKPFWRNMRSEFPDVRITVEETAVEGDTAVARVTLEGTHTGEGLAAPPTGHRVRVRGMVMIRVSGGRMVEGWNSWDQLGQLQQIGALPVHDAAERFVAERH